MKHGEVIIYQSADGTSHLDVRLESDTVWLTRQQMAESKTEEKDMMVMMCDGEPRYACIRKSRTHYGSEGILEFLFFRYL